MFEYFTLAGILLAQALLEWKYLGTDSKPGLAACLLFLFFDILVYQAVGTPSLVWATEVWPTTLRADGVSLILFDYFVGAITYTLSGALMIKNMGWHIYQLFIGLYIISVFIQETRGAPIEKLAALFGDHVMIRMTEVGQGLVKTDTEHVVKVDIMLSAYGGPTKTATG